MRVVVVQTGAANTASVVGALVRAGAVPEVTDRADALGAAERVVLPGVGAFGPAMARLTTSGLADLLRERVDADRPTLAICLGFQLLFRASEESPGVAGLGRIDARITAFDCGVMSPQMGWNRVRPGPGSMLTAGWAYFANSFKADGLPRGWVGSTAEHGGRFVAAAERGAVLGCQFHPELSGAWGQEILRRWLC